MYQFEVQMIQGPEDGRRIWVNSSEVKKFVDYYHFDEDRYATGLISIYGRTSHFKWKFVGYKHGSKVKEMMNGH